ncbi:50S ribosomal protein L13 [Candidatus Woesearchaeota archaeon]|nr:50S ribosomal protein L13 [Candidatus Woesearchaeota archaeon]
MIVIDATNQILGRLATFAAKQTLLGEEVRIINSEKAVISGTKSNIVAKYTRLRSMGIPAKGPYFPRLPDRFVRRAIRGMLPHNQARGREAFKRVLCYVGVPAEFAGKETIMPGADASKLIDTKYMTVKEITTILGAKQ